MQKEYLSSLDGAVGKLVVDIEYNSEVGIAIVPQPERHTYACKPDVNQAQILVPTSKKLDSSAVFHELLHLRRFLVEKIPCLIVSDSYEPCTPAVQDALISHDNSFEHLVIVPMEIELYPARRSHWEDSITRELRKIEEKMLGDFENRCSTIVQWNFLRHVFPDSDLLNVAHNLLLKFGWVDAAERFFERITPVISKKENAIKIWCEELGISPEIVAFKYLDAKNHTTREVALTDT